jgi:phosphate transport system permease protein
MSVQDARQAMVGGRSAAGHKFIEWTVHATLLLCAVVSVLTTLGIVAVLLFESLQFFGAVSLREFLTDTQWTPLMQPQHFGILPLLCGTALVAAGSALFAIPLGLATAVYLSEYASSRARGTIKPALEILAGVPSVVYGYLGLVVVSPWIRWAEAQLVAAWNALGLFGVQLAPKVGVFNAASACIVVGIMVLPMVVSLSEDVLRSVPRSLREGAYALGATKYDVTVRVVLPAALSGILASFLLAISRAVGETMAVTLCAGGTPRLTLDPRESIQAMTAFIVQVSQGDTPAGSPEYRAIFAVGLALFCSTMLLNLMSQFILRRMREQYE